MAWLSRCASQSKARSTSTTQSWACCWTENCVTVPRNRRHFSLPVSFRKIEEHRNRLKQFSSLANVTHRKERRFCASQADIVSIFETKILLDSINDASEYMQLVFMTSQPPFPECNGNLLNRMAISNELVVCPKLWVLQILFLNRLFSVIYLSINYRFQSSCDQYSLCKWFTLKSMFSDINLSINCIFQLSHECTLGIKHCATFLCS